MTEILLVAMALIVGGGVGFELGLRAGYRSAVRYLRDIPDRQPVPGEYADMRAWFDGECG